MVALQSLSLAVGAKLADSSSSVWEVFGPLSEAKNVAREIFLSISAL